MKLGFVQPAFKVFLAERCNVPPHLRVHLCRCHGPRSRHHSNEQKRCPPCFAVSPSLFCSVQAKCPFSLDSPDPLQCMDKVCPNYREHCHGQQALCSHGFGQE